MFAQVRKRMNMGFGFVHILEDYLRVYMVYYSWVREARRTPIILGCPPAFPSSPPSVQLCSPASSSCMLALFRFPRPAQLGGRRGGPIYKGFTRGKFPPPSPPPRPHEKLSAKSSPVFYSYFCGRLEPCQRAFNCLAKSVG